MSDTFLIFAPAILFDLVTLFFIFIYRQRIPFDEETKPEIIINSNYWGYLLFPYVFIIPCGWLVALTQDNPNLKFLPFLIFSLVIMISIPLFFYFGFKRYYFTSKGIFVLNLVSGKYKFYAIETIKGYYYRMGIRSSDTYGVVFMNNTKISFDAFQIKNKKKFIEYFEKLNLKYYEYDSLTDNFYLKEK